MNLRKKSLSSGFTLIEVLMVVAVFALISTITYLGSVRGTLEKGRDSKRKTDLNKLVRVMEDYYNDQGRYPPANDPPDGNISLVPWGAAFLPYVAELPKDPLSPTKQYYYQTDASRSFYVIYTRLENLTDPDIARVGCQSGCGIDAGNKVYNYLVKSTDVRLIDGVPQ